MLEHPVIAAAVALEGLGLLLLIATRLVHELTELVGAAKRLRSAWRAPAEELQQARPPRRLSRARRRERAAGDRD
ncbi:hypothetical protein OHB49_44075 (plasmid) [Streptomyces sp. NBC_01717]|uniref:hypothetical protein n=1 Tax=Streptomyces sp. NBC_01717 TaxID=2975918 RepID=UPI002E371848|nr:hypothetical protein [Streptomyces sp. NBC_01717]